MAISRLTTALTEGQLSLPVGEIAVLRPGAEMDLSALPEDRVRIAQGFRPDHDAWAARGYRVATDATAAAMAVVCVPRSKVQARAMVAEAARLAPLVVVDGQKTDGVDSLWRDVRAVLGDVPSLTKAHGRMFWFAGGAAFDHWAALPPARGADGFFRQAGVFSDDAVDAASALLAGALPAKLPARICDLGAGWGFLTAAVLTHEGVVSVDAIEAEALAIDCARLNVTDPRAKFHWADATKFAPGKVFDGIVMNPPFHAGRAADPDLGRAFIAAAARMLSPVGQLWMVANRHLPYDATLNEKFRLVTEIAGTPAFRVIHAARPKR